MLPPQPGMFPPHIPHGIDVRHLFAHLSSRCLFIMGAAVNRRKGLLRHS